MFILSRKIQKIKKGSTQKGNEVNDSCLLNKKLVACAQNLKKHASRQNSKERPKVFFSRRPSKHLKRQTAISKEPQDYPNDQTLTSGRQTQTISPKTPSTSPSTPSQTPSTVLTTSIVKASKTFQATYTSKTATTSSAPATPKLCSKNDQLFRTNPSSSSKINPIFNSYIRHIKTGLSSRRSSKSALGMTVLSQPHKGSRNIALKSSLTSKITQSFQKNSRKKKGKIKTKRVSLALLRSEEKLIIFRNHLPNKREILTDKLSNKLNSIYFKYYKSGYEPYDKEREESQERSSSKMFTPKRSKKSIKKRRSSKKVTNPKHASGKLTSKLKSVIKTLNKYENSLRSESQ
ncbi:unnamed protein product [Moneuplotes crassus]|uniref:Uncharacterized protein n=1 Tax=Euplotes crassus TaxID=5936 RepID=A0AAD1Y170_EUPCR|nr:unnamed protein product [Moneuplotes crassus]